MIQVTSPVDWELAQRVAVRIAGREPFAESYHYSSLAPDFEELTAEAEELVGMSTGLRSLAGPARAKVTDRADWVRANIASFQRMLRPLTEKLEAKMSSGPMAPFARRATGAELGAVLGWMSTRVLGQYDMLILEEESPLDQDMVYYVGPNVLSLEKRFAFPPREFRLWLALHEVTHRAQFTGVPWLREHFLGLINETLEFVDPDPRRFMVALGRMAESLRTGQSPFDDGGLLVLFASTEQRDVLDRIGGLMSLLEGHGDVTMDRAGADRISSSERFGRVLRRRRKNVQGPARFLQRLIGLEAKIKQYEQGEKFIAAVEATGGPELLDRAFEGPENLPSMTEIREPKRWINRMKAIAPAG